MTPPPRRRSLGIRARLFMGFALLLTAAAALMAFVVVTGLQLVPSYSTTIVVPSPDGGGVVPASPMPSAPPAGSNPGDPLLPGQHFPGAVMPGAKVSSTDDVRSTVLTATTIGIGLVLATGLTAGWFVTRRLLTPLRAVSEAAVRVAEGDLHHRIHAEGPADELTNLADSFDTMTARLEQSFGAHRRFAANASHELLTPLATTRTILQVVEGDTSEDEFRELLPMLVDANNRSIAIVRSLLRLADAENARLDLRSVDLGDLVARTVDEYAAESRDRGVHLDVDGDADRDVNVGSEGDCRVEADPVLLRQLVANLIENGVGHNIAGGSLRMSVRRLGGTVVLEAANTGPLVDDETADRLFEPFYRAKSRVGAVGPVGTDETGYGLGLSIVQAITRAHDGSVDATANPGGGITVRVELPARPLP